MAKSNWISRKLVSCIGFALGGLVERYEFPTAYLVATSSFDKEIICKVARFLNLNVHYSNNEWKEKGKSIKELIKDKTYGQEKKKQD